MQDLLDNIDQMQIKIEKHRPLDPQALLELRQYFNIGLTYSSNALEGNSLTEAETKVVLEEGLTIGGKPLKDHAEALGHAEAFDHLYTLTSKDGFSCKDIRKLHRLFYYRLNEKEAGKWRKRRVFLSGSKYPLPTSRDVSPMMKDFCLWVEASIGRFHPVEFGAEVHRRLVFIHPFIDGNGRVGRLLMNLVYLQNGYPIAIIPPVLRAKYIDCLELAHEDTRPFNRFIAERVLETQKDYLRLLI
jgi:Fic family protein